jgi:hypothetical protein
VDVLAKQLDFAWAEDNRDFSWRPVLIFAYALMVAVVLGVLVGRRRR